MLKSILIFMSIFVVSSCNTTSQKNITYIFIKGSDTMLILTRLWAQEYMKLYNNTSIYTEGGGSASGITSLIEGNIDICAASRPMKAFEVRQLAEKHSRLGISFLVGKDALSIYLNPENPVNNLTFKQLQDIFTGKITNWSDIGGPDKKIDVFSRSPNSGTFLYVKDHILDGKDFLDNAQIFNTTNAIIKAIEQNKFAIGYGGIAYGENIKHVFINNIAPTVANVKNNTYPLSRYLYFYTIDSPKGEIKEFIDWVLSQPGQTIVAKSGYIPLWNMSKN